jgi:uncharacterized BrkB/YihY/UPF0761 family membrane protein
MNKEDQFWAFCWTLVAAVVLAFMVVNSIYFDAKSTKWVKAVSESDNPVALACALKVEEGDHYMPQICTLVIK